MLEREFTPVARDGASPFHEGEKIVQERLGVRKVEEWARKVIRSFMPEQHREFFEAQPFLIMAARDADGRPWATLLEGDEGFVRSPDPASLEIRSRPVRGDALEGAFRTGADLAILGIELATRRRNRANGRIGRADGDTIAFKLDQSFGNCPQYIRARDIWRSPDEPAAKVVRGTRLSAPQKRWIETANTFFIGTGYRGEGDNPAYGLDVSHRGGERGFVEVLSDSRIRFPDYAGNDYYNTLGNILKDARTGLLFLDFSTGSLLQLTGRATIDSAPDEARKASGVRLQVSFEIDEIVELESALRLRWQDNAETARSLRLIEKTRESEDVTSFLFEARDRGPLPAFEAGQHLPIELTLPGSGGKLIRTYSLSGSPTDPHYRISVKRTPGGAVSSHLHEAFEPGAIIESGRPAGDFTLPETATPLVLASAGIGITPMLSMLHILAAEEAGRPVWFVHGTRDGAHHPFREEIRRLAAERPNIRVVTYYSRPAASDLRSRDFDHPGRISAQNLAALADPAQAQYLLCGPAAFLADLEAGLKAIGVRDDRIRYETF